MKKTAKRLCAVFSLVLLLAVAIPWPVSAEAAPLLNGHMSLLNFENAPLGDTLDGNCVETATAEVVDVSAEGYGYERAARFSLTSATKEVGTGFYTERPGMQFSFDAPETKLGADFDYDAFVGLALRVKMVEEQGPMAAVSAGSDGEDNWFKTHVIYTRTENPDDPGNYVVKYTEAAPQPGDEFATYLIDAEGHIKTNALRYCDEVQAIENNWQWTEKDEKIIPYDYDGWVVFPKEYFMNSLDGKTMNTVKLQFKYAWYTPGIVSTCTLYEVAAVYDLEAFQTWARGAITPVISTQPVDTTGHEGETATFTVAATSPNEGTLTYQWQVSEDAGTSWKDIPGATGAAYTTGVLSAADDNDLYRCYIVNTKGNAVDAVYTYSAQLLMGRLPNKRFTADIYEAEELPADLFKEYAGMGDSTITVTLTDVGKFSYSWTFVGKDVTSAVAFNPVIDILSNADLAVATDSGLGDALYFRTRHTGEMPGRAVFTVDSSFYFMNGAAVYLYKYNPDTKVFTQVGEELIQEEGLLSFVVDEAGQYVLNVDEIVGKVAEDKADGDAADDAGGTLPATGEKDAVSAGVLLLCLSAGALLALCRRVVV